MHDRGGICNFRVADLKLAPSRQELRVAKRADQSKCVAAAACAPWAVANVTSHLIVAVEALRMAAQFARRRL